MHEPQHDEPQVEMIGDLSFRIDIAPKEATTFELLMELVRRTESRDDLVRWFRQIVPWAAAHFAHKWIHPADIILETMEWVKLAMWNWLTKYSDGSDAACDDFSVVVRHLLLEMPLEWWERWVPPNRFEYLHQFDDE